MPSRNGSLFTSQTNPKNIRKIKSLVRSLQPSQIPAVNQNTASAYLASLTMSNNLKKQNAARNTSSRRMSTARRSRNKQLYLNKARYAPARKPPLNVAPTPPPPSPKASQAASPKKNTSTTKRTQRNKAIQTNNQTNYNNYPYVPFQYKPNNLKKTFEQNEINQLKFANQLSERLGFKPQNLVPATLGENLSNDRIRAREQIKNALRILLDETATDIQRAYRESARARAQQKLLETQIALATNNNYFAYR